MERKNTIVHVVGARPNFMKLAPVHRALARRGVAQAVIHTGQHYDDAMSRRFFEELEIPTPDIDLGVGSGGHALQTGTVMIRLEQELAGRVPRWTVVYGDVNSTMAAALVAAKLHLPVAHVEAGLRSRDRRMPEEINRIVTDRVADLLFTPSPGAGENLRAEGVDPGRIVFAGNVMIDTLFGALERIGRGEGPGGPDPRGPVVVTLHRPSNVDDPERLRTILDELRRLAGARSVVFPAHPRTRARIRELGVTPAPGIDLREPLGYLEMIRLMAGAAAILTDSGGIQEESSVLGIPCVTLRPNTERPVTIEHGTNVLEPDPERAVDRLLEDRPVRPMRLEGWDGQASVRIAEALLER